MTDDTRIVKISDQLTLEVQENGSFCCLVPYVQGDDSGAVLDGDFSTDELRAILSLVADAANKPKETK